MAILFITASRRRRYQVTERYENLKLNNGNFDEKRLLCDVIFKHLKIKEGKIVGWTTTRPSGLSPLKPRVPELSPVVEIGGFEPPTPAMRTQCSPS